MLTLGPAVEVGFGEASAVGGEVSLELELVERWLEIELGVSLLGGPKGGQLELDLLFKKPFAVAPRLEVMPGLGPLWVREMSGSVDRFGIEIAVDVMWWVFGPRLGLGAEPNLGMTFASGLQASVGLTLGLLIGW